jgi:hypothetical protein
VTTAGGDIVNDVVAGFDAMSTANTQIWVDSGASALRGGGSHKTAAGASTAIAWTQASATNWCIGAAVLNAAVGIVDKMSFSTGLLKTRTYRPRPFAPGIAR